MAVATSESRVGVRDLRDALSRHLARVRAGETVIVTDHGRPIARLVPYETVSPLERMIAEGFARPPLRPRAALPAPITAAGTVSDLIAEQRR
ncbi:type II toxin-antitoxin system Phd/YefM family antitoxin [Agromyces sp. NPDC058484]|uniref:type II toxin-antitoxin system Phd/YefM family antitoxin n=1 Tax=Agromyces sp. NPDC058484 TaxID=3346524 RepID=UPI003667BC44